VKKPVDVSGDPREHKWLYQRQSLAVVRGNTASILYWPVCKFDLILHYWLLLMHLPALLPATCPCISV